MHRPLAKFLAALALAAWFAGNISYLDAASVPSWWKQSAAKLESELTVKYGEPQRPRLQRGLRQIGQLWQKADGDAAAFELFVRENFAGDQATLDTLFARFERLLEKLDGHFTELRYEFKRQTDLDLGIRRLEVG